MLPPLGLGIALLGTGLVIGLGVLLAPGAGFEVEPATGDGAGVLWSEGAPEDGDGKGKGPSSPGLLVLTEALQPPTVDNDPKHRARVLICVCSMFILQFF